MIVITRPGKSKDFGNVIPGKKAALSGKGEGEKKKRKKESELREKKEKKERKEKEKKRKGGWDPAKSDRLSRWHKPRVLRKLTKKGKESKANKRRETIPPTRDLHSQ